MADIIVIYTVVVGLLLHVFFCQPRVEVTSCFVYKVMGLTFHDKINTQLIYRFELAQVVARRITKIILRTFKLKKKSRCILVEYLPTR